MRFEDYRDLIRRLEAEAARDARAYTLRVGAFGALGYVYIVLVFAALASLLALVFGVRHAHVTGWLWFGLKLGIVLVPMGWSLLRALMVHVPPPQGVELTPARVPVLFDKINQVARMVHAPRPDRVLLTADYNCSILQRPRLGIFGWPENILILGLPMLETLSPARFRSVLAHEFGHLGADHGTLSGRLYAVSDAWRHLLGQLEARRSLLLRLFTPFFNWYGPRFGAMAFVLGRRKEHFADACARRAAGDRATRSALVRIEVMARHYRSVMEHVAFARVRETPAPPPDIVAEVSVRMREDPATDRAQQWLDEAMRAETGYEDTHPALRDRLAALDPKAKVTVADALAEPGSTAAQDAFAGALDALAMEVGALWVADLAPAWRARHEQLGEAERLASAYESGDAEAHAAPNAEWKAVIARLELESEACAFERLDAFLAAHRDHALAHFRMGEMLLARGDERGLMHLERSMRLDSDATPAGCEAATRFLRGQGRGEAADGFTRRAWEFSELLEKSNAERSVLLRKDQLVAHDVPEAAVAKLRARLEREEWIQAAYLARKEVALRPEKPCYVLGLAPHHPWWRYVNPKRDAEKAIALLRDESLPEGTWMFFLDGELRWAQKRIGQIEGGRVWDRKWQGVGAAKPAAVPAIATGEAEERRAAA